MNCNSCHKLFKTDFRIPLILTSCGHTTCSTCLQLNREEYNVNCTECTEISDIRNIRTNFYLLDLIQNSSNNFYQYFDESKASRININEFNEEGKFYIRKNQKLSKIILKNALLSNPNSIVILLYIAYMYMEINTTNNNNTNNTNEYIKALECYNKILNIDELCVEALINKAIILEIYLMDYNKALLYIEKALEINIDLVIGYNNKGVVLFKINRIEEAISTLDKCIKLDYKYSDAYYNKGIIYESIHKYNQAIENYNMAIKYNPEKCWKALNAKGILNYYISVYNNNNDDDENNNNNKDKENTNNNPNNPLEIKHNIHNNSDNHNNTINIINNPNNNIDLDHIISFFSKSLSIFPNAEAYNNIGIIYSEKEDYTNSILNFDKSIELDSSLIQAYINKADLLYENNNLDEALSVYSLAVIKDPFNYCIHFSLSAVLYKKERLREALYHINKAQKINETAQVYKLRGLILDELKNFNSSSNNYNIDSLDKLAELAEINNTIGDQYSTYEEDVKRSKASYEKNKSEIEDCMIY